MAKTQTGDETNLHSAKTTTTLLHRVRRPSEDSGDVDLGFCRPEATSSNRVCLLFMDDKSVPFMVPYRTTCIEAYATHQLRLLLKERLMTQIASSEQRSTEGEENFGEHQKRRKAHETSMGGVHNGGTGRLECRCIEALFGLCRHVL